MSNCNSVVTPVETCIHFYYLREKVSKGRLGLEHSKCENQVANILSKELKKYTFKRLRDELGVLA